MLFRDLCFDRFTNTSFSYRKLERDVCANKFIEERMQLEAEHKKRVQDLESKLKDAVMKLDTFKSTVGELSRDAERAKEEREEARSRLKEQLHGIIQGLDATL